MLLQSGFSNRFHPPMHEIPWYLDERFWQLFYPVMFGPERFELARRQVPQLLRFLDLSRGQVVLDLACGPGRHSVPLAQAGLRVTGLDASPFLLQQARAYAREAGVKPRWLRQDMRAPLGEGEYEAVLCLWSSFGYFDDPGDDLLVLQQVRRALKPGGRLLLDLVGKETLLRELQPVHCTEFEHGDLLFERPVLTDNMRRLENVWYLIRDGQVHEQTWAHNIYTAAELEQLCRQAGFSRIEAYADLDGGEYDLEAERLLLLAVK